ncbi:hypothetical protein TSUD_199990 [Trifolium subterraneum]|nr:hypothetical protein TSUD_199990 [Trifolium subterraneum]
MKTPLSSFYRNPVKFRMPTSDNLVPIRLDIEIDGHRYKDAFTWNPSDPDSEIVVFAKRTVKDLKLPPPFITQIAQSIQSQLAEFRSYDGQDMYAGDKIVPIKPAVAFAIREQLYEIAIQSVVSARESRLSKKSRRGVDFTPVSKGGAVAVDLVKLFGIKSSVVRKRKEWDVYEPIVDLLSNEEVDVLEAKEERNFR